MGINMAIQMGDSFIVIVQICCIIILNMIHVTMFAS